MTEQKISQRSTSAGSDYYIFSPTADDWGRLKDIRLAMLAESSDSFVDRLIDVKDKEDHYWQWFYGRLATDTTYGSAAVTQDETIVSVAFITFSEEYDNIWTVVSVFTRPEHRGNGLAKKVMHHLLGQFYDVHPNTDLYLHVTKTKEPAIKMYKALGFEVIDEWHDCVMGDGEKHSGYEMVLKKK